MGLAICRLRDEGIKSKIALIDIDYHPHDGTVEFFFEDAFTLCCSIHEKGWFDFDETLSKYHKNIINEPVKTGTRISFKDYLEKLEKNIFPKIRDFKPDIIILLHGVDGHENDKVTYYGLKDKAIALSTQEYEIIDHKICMLVNEVCNGRLLGLGAGGYSPTDTAEVWAQAVKIFFEDLKNSTS